MKTIEEFAVELSTKEVRKSDSYSQGLKVGIEFGVEKGVKFAQRWIPVEEELPVFDKTEYPNGNYETFFVKILTGGMNPIIRYGAAHLINDKRWSCEFDWNIVTHYRPIEYK